MNTICLLATLCTYCTSGAYRWSVCEYNMPVGDAVARAEPIAVGTRLDLNKEAR